MKESNNKSRFNVTRLIIAAPQGRSGKTLASIFLCAAFREKGLSVQPFKKGPDYIDPSWLTFASGHDCRNLDAVLMPESSLMEAFYAATTGIDIAVIEGAMGLYDGLGSDDFGSTAYLAKELKCPVILVINCARMTTSVAAMIGGYISFDPEVNISGIILNNVAGKRHEQTLRVVLAKHYKVPVVGVIHRDPEITIAERHLGLIPSVESSEREVVSRILERLQDNFDIESILNIARSAPELEVNPAVPVKKKKKGAVRIGIIDDQVFSFYYPENREALVKAGAELVSISSIKDTKLPLIDGLYIGGGFPELFVSQLEANRGLRDSIRTAVEDWLPVYAECGGLMYLCRKVKWQNKWYEMAGAIDAEVEVLDRPQGHGYVSVEVKRENPFFPEGFRFWGHEFHYSRIIDPANLEFAFKLSKGNGIDGASDGIVKKNMLATYTHLHAAGVPQWAESFVNLAVRMREEQEESPVAKKGLI
jgi:cobyrinic acid a,c-diamide synthase